MFRKYNECLYRLKLYNFTQEQIKELIAKSSDFYNENKIVTAYKISEILSELNDDDNIGDNYDDDGNEY
jgi:hypothetical protein